MWNQCPEKISKVLAMLLLSSQDNADLRWFGFALSMFDIKTDKRIPTAALTIDPQRIVPRIIFNPDFVEKLSEGELIAVLMHELWHYLNQTFSRQGLRDEEKWNFAVDGVINYHIEQDLSNNKRVAAKIALPDKCIKLPPGDFQDKSTIYSENVYDMLQNNDGNSSELSKEYQKFVNGEIGLVDDHSLMDEFDKVPEEILKNAIGTMINQAGNMAGSTPGGVERILAELYKSVVPWTKLLRDFEGQNMKIGYKGSWKRPNRRVPGLVQGRSTLRGGRLAVLIDVSGSTSNDMPRFFGEAVELAKRHETWVVQCDAQVQGKPEKLRPHAMPVARGGGGTILNPGLEACMKLKPDMVIVFTDGYVFDTLIDLPVPTLYVISTGGAEVSGKRCIFIEENRNVT